MRDHSPGASPSGVQDALDDDQIRRVRSSWADLGSSWRSAGDRFYMRLFEVAPETRPLFGADMAEQTLKFLRMLDLIVVALDDRHELDRLTASLGRSHRGYGVRPAHYEAVDVSLLDALAETLGGRFTQADRDAWSAAFGFLRDAMLAAARVGG